MLRNTLIISTLLASSMVMSGCSPIWKKLGDLSYSMAEFTKPAALRGLSTKSEESFDETSTAENNVYKTAIGEYTPTELSYDDAGNAIVDTSQHPCPDGTYLNEENACMFLETDTYEFEDNFTLNASLPIETGPVPCPDETYLTAENTCAYLENDTFDFADELATSTPLPVETGPIPCPEGTYLTAENTCTYLETEEFDFAETDEFPNPPIEKFEYSEEVKVAVKTPELPKFRTTDSVECPEGFKPDAKNSCMYLGAELTLK